MKKIIILLCSFVFVSSSAFANWACNVSDGQEHQFSFAAPTEDDAENIANTVCKTLSIKEQDCTPDCVDTGEAKPRWHCGVQKNAKESWSFTMPEKSQALTLAKNTCASHKIAAKDCKPVCAVE